MALPKRETAETHHRRGGFITCEFEDVNSPGVYVERQTGNLLRIPEDALAPGRSPALEVLSNEPWIVTKISNDPYLPVTKARMVAADFDLTINF